jgi:hypothetical protein
VTLRALRLKAALAACCLLPTWGGLASAGDLQLRPNISVSEEYNDNIFESVTNRSDEWVTRVRPGLALGYRTPALDGKLSYNLDYATYAYGSHKDETNHRANLAGNAELVENFLYLNATDTLSRVSLSVVRDVTGESPFLNQTQQNLAQVTPYLLWHPGTKSELKTGYQYLDTRYWSSNGIDKQQHRAYADYTLQPSERFSLSAGYSYSIFNTDVTDYRQHDVSGGMRYQYGEKSFLYGSVGNSWQEFASGRAVSNLIWNAGVAHDFEWVLATLDAKVSYTEDPLSISTKQTSYLAKLDRALAKGTLGVSASYTEYDRSLAGLGTFPGNNKLAFGGYGSYQLASGLNGILTLGADRVTGGGELPYHLTGNAVLSYLFNYGITAALSYTRVEYRHHWESATGARQTDRTVLELSKVFGS